MMIGYFRDGTLMRPCLSVSLMPELLYLPKKKGSKITNKTEMCLRLNFMQQGQLETNYVVINVMK